MASVLDELAVETKGRVVVGLILVNERELMRAFEITKIPATFLIRNAQVKASFVGALPKAQVHKILKDNGA
jgi:thioredoxin 1